MKKVKLIKKTNGSHWVGDGFPVRTIFSYHDFDKDISPFLLMDYAGPYKFSATKEKRGVGEHPHRGFETVTIVYSGEVEHRDSSGGGGIIKDGDVQWMTAASGLVHEEFHGKDFAEKGGDFEMIQLWVNLPKEFKMSPPRYQAIKSESISVHNLPNEAGVVRLISGELENTKGPAKTFSPVNLWDLRLNEGKTVNLNVPAGHTASLFVLDGEIEIDGQIANAAELVVLENSDDQIQFKVNKDSKILFMGGEIIDEPIFGYGPFVMSSYDEIEQAFLDFQKGKMGQLGPIEGSD